MNKAEKIICLVLGAVLAWYIFSETGRVRQDDGGNSAAAAERAAEAGAGNGEAAGAGAAVSAGSPAPAVGQASAPPATATKPTVPEQVVSLENDDVRLELTSWGAGVRKVTLKRFARDCGPLSADNPAVALDFAASPLGSSGAVEAFDIVAQDAESVTFRKGAATRTVTLRADYRIDFADDGLSGPMSLGAMHMGDSKNELLSVDSLALDAGKGKPGVIHHGDGDSPLKPYLAGGMAGGCSGATSAAGMPEEVEVPYPGGQAWVAVKNRFFVTALASCSAASTGFTTTVRRDMTAASYRPASVTAKVDFATDAQKRTATFYVGPKKQALLWDLGMRDVMEFGMWRWLCYPLVWVLNLFNGWIPNFGVAIILLTILVRLVFWPLTHKSTEGMRKMQEIQPLMKEIQAKYKDNPQRLQQETWQLYREKKVNPASSCLPMLIQIPVFIALFNVLRSAVELRYAPFLWIADLSEPEALFASWFPFGGLNLLPIAMAATTALQSYFTPSGGDRRQQRMMMVMMPAMMLVMFYSFPSALSLYWFLSNVFSIVQMWLIRRQTAAKSGVLTPEVIDPPTTRQMRRHA
ncbi:MAG: YidC/Oxa1 family insertase periplasmic-domain containing protein [Kiritimatiellia bacterium]